MEDKRDWENADSLMIRRALKGHLRYNVRMASKRKLELRDSLAKRLGIDASMVTTSVGVSRQIKEFERKLQ